MKNDNKLHLTTIFAYAEAFLEERICELETRASREGLVGGENALLEGFKKEYMQIIEGQIDHTLEAVCKCCGETYTLKDDKGLDICPNCEPSWEWCGLCETHEHKDNIYYVYCGYGEGLKVCHDCLEMGLKNGTIHSVKEPSMENFSYVLADYVEEHKELIRECGF